MRQIWITKAGPPEVLMVREASDPEPQAGEVRIRVEASGINFADLLARMGLYPDAPKIPCVVGYEVAGVIDMVGEGVTDLYPDQAILAITPFGGYSDTVCVPAIRVFPRPPGMSAYEGAALLVNYLTAYQMLVVMGSLHAGDRVLIHSAAGGVGLAALNICTLMGAETIGVASETKHAFLYEKGIQHTIDSQKQSYVDEIKHITRGEGVDIVLDSLGGENWSKNYALLAPTGRLLCFGVSSLVAGNRRSLMALLNFARSIKLFTPIQLMNDNKAIAGVNMAHLQDRPQLVRKWANHLLMWYTEEKIKPHIDRVFSFGEAATAHHYLHDRKGIGKVLLEPETR